MAENESYPAYMILTLRSLLEKDGNDNPDLAARQWCEQGWRDPSAAYNEWGGIGATDPDRAWALRQAGLSLEDASREVVVDGETGTIARFFNDDLLSIEDAAGMADVDPIADLRNLAADRGKAEFALGEIRRIGKIKAAEARKKGASVAEIAEAFGVSRQGAYDLLD